MSSPSSAAPLASLLLTPSSPLRRLLRWSAVGGCAAYTFSLYVGSPLLLRGSSMEPTLADGHLVFCRPWPWCGQVRTGDVVLVRHPQEPRTRLCKRVVAVAGQPMMSSSSNSSSIVVDSAVVPPGHVCLAGDNRGRSKEPAGAVPLGLVEGKVAARLFPSFATSDAWDWGDKK